MIILEATVIYVTEEVSAGNPAAIEFFKNIENMEIVRRNENYVVLQEKQEET